MTEHRTVSGPDDPDALAFVREVVTGPAGREPEDFLEALARIRDLREQLTQYEPQLIDAARRRGVSWAQLAPALGVASRQAAERRYLRLSPNATDPSMNGEQRLQAVRDQRAGDRAVATWARQNAADLRRLAGQISSLDDLDPVVQASVDQISVALGDDDSLALLGPLAAAQTGLSRDHPALADRIADVTDQTDEVRQGSRHRTADRASTEQKG
ncbi:hypothetical protein [Kribbella ginsengisoli]|uniref:DUF3156 family protein n=1 Tax=Kribbella ginsengisoli TaxID=363865 RepID=A0ABP6YWN5_9ACTN